jgi:protein-disulfide isomerase
VDGAPALGRPDAPLTLVEFASYQCVICKQHHDTVFPKLKQEYIDSGKVRYVFRDLPLKNEPRAAAAANAAHCAGAQGKYWEMHRALFEKQSDLSAEGLAARAKALGLDTGKFAACLSADTFAALVQRGPADAQGAGFRGTPSFVLGPTADGDRITGVRVIGAQSFAAFKQVIEHQLEEIGGK